MIGYCNDLHVHTNLSVCAPRYSYAENYIPYCKQENVKVIGFTDHVYIKERMQAEHPEFKGTPGEYPALLREEVEELREQNKDLKILLGCEAEVIYGRDFDVTFEESKNYDYVALAPSHILNLGNLYSGMDFSTPEKLRAFMLERFKIACKIKLAVPTVICHPLYPILSEFEQQVVDGITDSELGECFDLARENDKAIEIHACLYRKGTVRNADGLSPSYLRILEVAKECGCKFYMGSDAHQLRDFVGAHEKLAKACEYLGVTEYDLWELGRV